MHSISGQPPNHPSGFHGTAGSQRFWGSITFAKSWPCNVNIAHLTAKSPMASKPTAPCSMQTGAAFWHQNALMSDSAWMVPSNSMIATVSPKGAGRLSGKPCAVMSFCGSTRSTLTYCVLLTVIMSAIPPKSINSSNRSGQPTSGFCPWWKRSPIHKMLSANRVFRLKPSGLSCALFSTSGNAGISARSTCRYLKRCPERLWVRSRGFAFFVKPAATYRSSNTTETFMPVTISWTTDT